MDRSQRAARKVPLSAAALSDTAQSATGPKGALPLLDTLIGRHGDAPESLLQILADLQVERGWIEAEMIDELERRLGVPRVRIEGVASFYSFLHLQPAGRYRILFSDNITDRMLGNEALLDRLCHALWIERGKCSEDGLVSVDFSSCTGLCDQGPAILVNGIAMTRMTPDRIDRIAELVREQVPVQAWPREWREIQDNVHRAGPILGNTLKPGEAIAAAADRIRANGAMAVIDELLRSKLRGRGGAGFATGLKWKACAQAPLRPGDHRVVVCNADEGEPGTFKDRVLLTSHADLIFEGMTVAALSIGAREGFLYLRGEYRYLRDTLEATLARRRAQDLLGTRIAGIDGFDFDIRIHLGAGAYVCGEESALIESLEGKRGTPRIRPPFPVTNGYRDMPTAVNNVETLACAALIAVHGGEWFGGIGTPQATGTKILSVSGDCERPGLYEFPFGTRVREVLDACGARDTQAVQNSGPSGVTLSEQEFDRTFGFEDLGTAGALMVFDRTRDMFEVARRFVHFFAHESCGFCTPCRVGTSLLRNLMDKLAEGKGSRQDFARIEELNALLLAGSHCGLGHTACNPVLDTVAKFRPGYEQRLVRKDFMPAFDLDAALIPSRQLTGRDDALAHLDDA